MDTTAIATSTTTSSSTTTSPDVPPTPLPPALSTLTKLALHPHLFPAVVARFLTDSDVSSCMLVNQPLHTRLSAHSTFWRYICHRTYRAPAYRPPKLAALDTFPSWKEYWYTRPRVHTHGFYCVKISYLPSRREIPPGHIEIGSQRRARSSYADIPMVTYYRYFWFLPNGVVRHACVPDPPNIVRLNLGGLSPLSDSKRCCKRVVNIGTWKVSQKNIVDITLPNISRDTEIVVKLRIAYPKGQYGAYPLKPLPPRGSFFILLPMAFDLKSRSFNGGTHLTAMPITFGELFNFYSCNAPSKDKVRVQGETKESMGGGVQGGSGVLTSTGSGVLLSAEEEKAAARESSLT